jgi:hypothetical protein
VSDEQRRSLALLLAVSARALAFVFVVAVAVRLLPVQALNPAWQMTVCSVLLHQAVLPLVALVMMHAASAVEPADGRLASARMRWRGLAVTAVLGFLLLLPLQGFATWRGLSQGIQQDATRRADAEKRSGAMLQAIQAATSDDELQARMQRLQGPTLTPADRALPLPQLRRQLENQRYGMEQYRYLQSIRTRWISEDLDQMKKRLIQFALERYWRSSMPER